MSANRKLNVLFICMGNANRSQMAEAFARAYKSDRIEPFSAGITPAGLGELTVEVMKELDIDITGQRSKHIEEFADKQIDYAVVLCPVVHRNTMWMASRFKVILVPFDDPPTEARHIDDEEQKRQVYRRVRDEIKRFVDTLPGGLIDIENRMKIEASERAMRELEAPRRKKWFFF
jgi:arsenate reductase